MPRSPYPLGQAREARWPIGLLDGGQSAAKFIVFDACRNVPQLPRKRPPGAYGSIPVRARAPWPKQRRMFIAYASAGARPQIAVSTAVITLRPWQPKLQSEVLII
jgi:hypothetical protein